MRRNISTSTRLILLEEKYLPCPWKVLLSCILLNRTTKEQVEPVLEKLLKKYPTPLKMSRAKAESLSKIIQPLGLHNQRGKTLKIFSQQVVESGITKENIRSLRGVGQYAEDAYLIFFHGSMKVPSQDYALKNYVTWKRKLSKSSSPLPQKYIPRLTA